MEEPDDANSWGTIDARETEEYSESTVPVFTGEKSENPSLWMQQVVVAMNLFEVPEPKMITLLALYTKGVALKKLMKYMETEVTLKVQKYFEILKKT
jgi:hypothetical protein